MIERILEMLKLLFYNFIFCVIASLLLNFSFDFSVQIFGYTACLFILPYFIKKPNTTVKAKFCIATVILAISVGATIYAEGIGKILFYNIIVFTVVLICCIAAQLRREKMS